MNELSAQDVSTIVQAICAVLSAIATVILAVLTGKYVKLTNHMLNETRANRGPSVYVDLELTSYKVDFVIGNIGKSAAQNIKFKVNDTIPWREDKYTPGLAHIHPIVNGISYLAPGRILKFECGLLDLDKISNLTGKVEIKLEYQTEDGINQRTEFYIDMGQYNGVLLASFDNPASEIARAIRSIEDRRSTDNALKRFSQGMFKKNCPFCGETISSSAIKCPRCLEHLNEGQENPT